MEEEMQLELNNLSDNTPEKKSMNNLSDNRQEKKDINNFSFEENIVKLENIVKELETGSCSLDSAIDKFTEGMRLAKLCGDKLNSATEKVNKILTENGELADFLEANE